MKKRIICAVLCVCTVLLSLCGCTEQKNNESTGGKTEKSESENKAITLLYNSSDTFNPYTAKTDTNREISHLLYDSLVTLDNDFNVVYRIAEDIKLTGNTCTVKLGDIYFTDGSSVTSEDVVFSSDSAKKSSSYSARFYEIKKYEAVDRKTVVFTLTKSDPYFTKLLDFPIIKSGTSGEYSNDGVEKAPVGCGRYTLNSASTELSVNKSYYGGKGNIEKIKLLHAPDKDSIAHYVEIGAASLYFADASDGSIIRMSGKKTDVNLNAFIYIGINENVPILKGKNIRYAISSAINRTDICKNAFYNNAVCATGYFNPAIEEVSPVQTIKSKSDSEITVENLNEIGYNILNSDGYYASESGNIITLSLLVNSENASRVAAAKLISNQLKSAGIKLNVVEKSYGEYIKSIKSGSFELYLGEINLLSNMDFSPLVVYGGAVAYGVANPNPKSDKKSDKKTEETADGTENAESVAETETEKAAKLVCQNAINDYYSGKSSLVNLAGTLLTEMPQIPICYRKGKFFYSDGISGDVSASLSDIYYSIGSYIINSK